MSDPSLSSDPEPLLLNAPQEAFCVEFSWQQDRFVQRFLRTDRLIAESVDRGQQDDDSSWPPSPPIQQLSLEPIGDNDVLLGVGAAGQSHWSISVEPTLHDQLPALKFDLACRCKSEPVWLGSTYRFEGSHLKVVPLDGPIEKTSLGMAIRPDTVVDSATARWAYLIVSDANA